MNLRPYQEEAIEKILEAKEKGITRQLLVLATGLGKTVIVAGLIHRLGFPKTFAFMHRKELIDQSVKKFHAFDPAVSIGIERDRYMVNLDRDTIAIASVQTVGRENRNRLSRFTPDWPTAVWVDEAHHAPSPSYKVVLDHFKVHGTEPNRDRLFLGTTATPDRLDKADYSLLFDDIVYRYGLREGIKDGWLADIKAFRMTADLDLSKVRSRYGDFVEKDLAKAVLKSNLDDVAVRTWKERCQGRRSIFFCVNQDHANHFCNLISAAGAKSALILDSTDKDTERPEILRKFEAGELDTIVNVGVLTEGFDCEKIETVHILRPTKSQSLYTQMIGRGTRKIPGVKETVDLFDYTEQIHDIASIGPIFGFPVDWKMKGQLMGEEAEQRDLIQGQLGATAHGATSIEDLIESLRHKKLRLLVGELVDSGLPSHLAWIRPSRTEERWLITWENKYVYLADANTKTLSFIYKHQLVGAAEQIEIFKNELGAYEAQWVATSPKKTMKRKLFTYNSLQKLVQTVEEKILGSRSHQWEYLRKNAAWRRREALDSEKERLKTIGVPDWVIPNLCSGEAASLLHCSRETIGMMFKGLEPPAAKTV